MLRTVFAIAIAGLALSTMSGSAQAAPVAPLHPRVMADLNILTDVQWGDAAGVTAGDACTVAVVVTAGVTAGAVGTAGGEFTC